MIEYVVARSSGSVLLLVTARPDFAEMRPGWNSRPGVSQVSLDPLTDGEVDQLLAQLLTGSPGELRGRVAASAEGNPFFAEEIIGHLLDQGILAREPQGLVEASRGAAALTIPDSVRALLAARVDALLAEEERTLQDAAVT